MDDKAITKRTEATQKLQIDFEGRLKEIRPVIRHFPNRPNTYMIIGAEVVLKNAGSTTSRPVSLKKPAIRNSLVNIFQNEISSNPRQDGLLLIYTQPGSNASAYFSDLTAAQEKTSGCNYIF